MTYTMKMTLHSTNKMVVAENLVTVKEVYAHDDADNRSNNTVNGDVRLENLYQRITLVRILLYITIKRTAKKIVRSNYPANIMRTARLLEIVGTRYQNVLHLSENVEIEVVRTLVEKGGNVLMDRCRLLVIRKTLYLKNAACMIVTTYTLANLR